MANSSTGVSNKEKKVYSYGKVSLSLQNSILPSDKMSPTPSESDGLDHEVENELRILGCELIQTSGVLLRLPQVAMATGQVLFQRFYYSKSFIRHAMEVVAMACITLASKIEEAPRRIRDVINVFHHIKQVKAGKTIQPLILDQNYINLKNQVIKGERRVLKELGFCVHVKHPHKIIVTLLEVLKLNNPKLMQTAWNYMNDSLRSEVFIRYNPESIACACIYLSARILQIALPNKPAWYLIFEVAEEDIHSICLIILSLYSNKKPDPERLDKTVDEVKKLHLEAKLKAKGIASANAIFGNHHSFSPTSAPSSPKNGKSPNADAKKEKEDSKTNNGITQKESNHRKRSSSPMDEDDSPRHRKKGKTSSSGSQSSRTPSPRHKYGKTPPRGYKESRRSRSRSKTRESNKKVKHSRSSHKGRKRSRSHSASLSPVLRKHSSKKSYKSKLNKSHHVSKSPPRVYEHNHHHHNMNSHEKPHKSRKEKTTHHSKEKSRR